MENRLGHNLNFKVNQELFSYLLDKTAELSKQENKPVSISEFIRRLIYKDMKKE